MVRSMFSGVSGLRAHQTRMDTIGNNIANVNTYGFKSGRTTFRDIYYQSMRTASQPTAAVGGMNPSSVGYGTKVGSVDLMMGRSTFSMTDQTMDIAIDGDGFLQVQDQAGNTYYTRAGMLNFDAAGNLVDMQGNFVLGVNGDPTGRSGSSERIQVVLSPVPPTPASVIQMVNGKEFTISAQNPTIDGNLNLNFTTNNKLSDGEVLAEISATGIIVQMHPDNTYSSLAELNSAINDAITQANDNVPHAAGNFQVSYTGPANENPFLPGVMPEGGYKASDIVSVDYGVQLGKVNFSNTGVFGGVYPSGKVGTTFGAAFASAAPEVQQFSCTYDDVGKKFSFTLTVDGVDYTGEVDSTKSSSGKFMLKNNNSDTDYIEMNRPSFGGILDAYGITAATAGVYNVLKPTDTQLTAAGTVFTVAGASYTSAGGSATDELDALVAAINASSTTHTAAVSGSNIVLTSRTPGAESAPAATFGGVAATVNTVTAGANANPGGFPVYTGADLGSGGVAPLATASGESKALGFSSTAFALRGGTAGGPQTIADMTGVSIAPNGVIIGWDAQGIEVIIGRVDIATFANPEGLNQSGSSNYTASANSGVPQLVQPGMNGAGKLVSGSLELSNVDLSREFSDMITTQRGYQANSRIITVSDTMLEELINLKR